MHRIRGLGIFIILAAFWCGHTLPAAGSNLTLGITANGKPDALTLEPGKNLTVAIQCTAGNLYGQAVEIWVLGEAPWGMHWCDQRAQWRSGMQVAYQGPLVDLAPRWIVSTTSLAEGSYKFFFIIDTIVNGQLDAAQYCYATKVTVQIQKQSRTVWSPRTGDPVYADDIMDAFFAAEDAGGSEGAVDWVLQSVQEGDYLYDPASGINREMITDVALYGYWPWGWLIGDDEAHADHYYSFTIEDYYGYPMLELWIGFN